MDSVQQQLTVSGIEEDFVETDTDIDVDDNLFEDDTNAQPVVEVLDPERFLKTQVELIESTAQLLNVTSSAACTLLRHFNFDPERAHQGYFEDPDGLRTALGLQLRTNTIVTYGRPGSTATCSVCFEEVDGSRVMAMHCAHGFCWLCWERYLCVQVDDGRACLHTTCLANGCNQIVDGSVFWELLPPTPLARFCAFVFRSFVDDNPLMRWCPNPSCDKVILCRDPTWPFVSCLCGFKLCFACGEQSHAPVPCTVLRDWQSRAGAGEGTSRQWLLTNTNPCPGCASPIQKDGGCPHMKCTRCRREFCWHCFQRWGPDHRCTRPNTRPANSIPAAPGTPEPLSAEQLSIYHSDYHDSLRRRVSELPSPLVNGLAEAVERLVENRITLRHMDLYANHFVLGGVGKGLLADLLDKVESTTDTLSKLLQEFLDDPSAKLVEEQVLLTAALARDQLNVVLKAIHSDVFTLDASVELSQVSS